MSAFERELDKFEEEFGEDFEEPPEPKKEEKKENENGWEEIESPESNILKPTAIGAGILAKILEIREGTYGIEAVLNVKGMDEPKVTPAHKILQGKLEQLQVGDIVKITYLGQITTGTLKKAENYRVVRKRGKELK